jgi:hypothetical protein
MPSSKSKRTTGPSGPAQRKKKPPTPPDGIAAEPPIVVTSGSLEIEMDRSIFPPDPGNPNKYKNASRRLTSIEIQDLASAPNTLMTLDLKGLAGGKVKILIKYEK